MFGAPVFVFAVMALFLVEGSTDSCQRAGEAYHRGDLGGAARELELCVDEHPSDISWLLRLCSVYQSLGREDDLFRASLLGIDRFPDERRFRVTAGIRAAQTGDLDAAARIFSDALSRWPGDGAFRENLAQVLHLRGMAGLDAGDNEAAASDLGRSVELDGANCDALMNLGRALYNTLRPEEALEVFDRVRRIRPDYPGVELHRGIVLVTVGRHREAVEALDAFLADRSDPDGHYFRGMARKSVGDCRSALEDFRIATAWVPSNADGFFELAGCLERLERVGEAEVAYRRAIELDPGRPRFQLALGQMLVRTGRREEGLAILKEARASYSEMVKDDQRGLLFQSIRPEDAASPGP